MNILDWSWREISGTVRMDTVFSKRGFKTVWDIISRTPKELKTLPGIGHTSIRQLEDSLREAGLRLEWNRDNPLPRPRCSSCPFHEWLKVGDDYKGMCTHEPTPVETDHQYSCSHHPDMATWLMEEYQKIQARRLPGYWDRVRC